MRRIDEKLAKIARGLYGPRDFILTFCKDADLLRGCSAAGRDPDGRLRNAPAYRGDMRRVIESDLADIVLTSLSSAEVFSEEGIYARSNVTPAVRLTDNTDIWQVRGGRYTQFPAIPFRSSRLENVRPVANLGLYALGFYNDIDIDHGTLSAYAEFRQSAASVGLRHLLRVGDPPIRVDTGEEDYAAYRNDALTRSLAGVATKERPLFVEVGYHGPRAMEELADWDPARVIFGLTGFKEGTTRDCLERLVQGERYGARTASFSRIDFDCEDPVLMMRAMRHVVREGMSSREAVQTYHADLEVAGLAPIRPLQEDIELTVPLLSRNHSRAA
ncbi:hypothetical protein [Salipiger mangrovisoli]|uniref:Uncharacterized protein n=1 Tax=Salipiger mangrovisoli TaxID=2865933 RepID=A0ABR9X7B2_9RHOB|nr:hypothetical protein [Salipiger mangrovisoli]MBE9639480.1 hypothetical protein [Salipiger mangrovisoli]